MRANFFFCAILCLFVFTKSNVADAIAPNITNISPARHTFDASRNSIISVSFDQAINPSTINFSNFRVFAASSGPVRGAFSFSPDARTVSLTPNREFSAGELITVNLSNAIAAQDGSLFRSSGFAWQFHARVEPSTLNYGLIDTKSTKLAAEISKAVIASAADLDHDNYLDLVCVNETSADLRVLRNQDNGSGTFNTLSAPVFAAGAQANSFAVGDVNNDAETDAAIGNAGANNVSILLGNNTAGFAAQTTFALPAAASGVTLLDVDGDADWDLVSTNYASNVIRQRINNGSGNFGLSDAFTTIEAGGNGEWPIASGDFNNDGIFDLAVGLADSESVSILLGIGDGNFAAPQTINVGGLTRSLALGDLNGDGNLDIAASNGSSNNAATIFGDGAGGFFFSVTYEIDSALLVHSALADLDGDLDLDWVISSLTNSRSSIYRNTGTGILNFDQQLSASTSSAASVLFDTDNDGDLDVSTIDQIADQVRFYKNLGFGIFEDIFANGYE